MKFMTSVKNVTIHVDSRWEEPEIEYVLKALAHVIYGVDQSGQWQLFEKLIATNAKLLIADLENEGVVE